MAPIKFTCVLIIALFLNACQSTKPLADKLYNTTWELDYISDPRIAFNGLFPDRKPQIAFDKTTHKVNGNASCNGYSAPYTLNGKNISFGEAGPATLMYCGEGEQVFLTTIKNIETYGFDEDGKLILMFDDITMMRFKKIN